MEYKKLIEYGNSLFIQTLHPLKTTRISKKHLIVGFDTEYNSKTNELISVQFSCLGHKKLYEIQVDNFYWKDLWKLLQSFLNEFKIPHNHKLVRGIYLVCFWSIAELQHIRDLHHSDYIGENITYNVSKAFGKQNLHVIDLFQFFKGSLANVSKMFGYEKMEYDTTNITRKDLKNPKFLEYAVHDAYLTESIFNEFRKLVLDSYNTDILISKSVANTSMSIFRKSFLTEKVGNMNTRIRKMSLLCSWGGNNQAFCRGDFRKNFRLYDANSMYPNSAIQLGVLPREKDWIFAKSMKDFLTGIGGVCKVWFEFPKDEKYPCIPVFKEGKLCYPLCGLSYCTLEEVKYALKCGAKVRLKTGYYYTDGNRDFIRYMKEMIKQKNSSKGVERAFYKLMMNSIIGKFTQKILNYDFNDVLKIARDIDIPFEQVAGIVNLNVKKKVNVGSGFCPEWNTIILGYARATQSIAFRENNAFVGTTDSIIMKGRIKHAKINGIEYEYEGRGNRLICLKTRVYALLDGNKILHLAHHGIHTKKDLVKLFEKALNEPTVTYDTRKIIKLRQSVRSGKRFGKEYQRIMNFNGGWDSKRTLNDNGTTVPLSN